MPLLILCTFKVHVGQVHVVYNYTQQPVLTKNMECFFYVNLYSKHFPHRMSTDAMPAMHLLPRQLWRVPMPSKLGSCFLSVLKSW